MGSGFAQERAPRNDAARDAAAFDLPGRVWHLFGGG
jgi:hypothetical protein